MDMESCVGLLFNKSLDSCIWQGAIFIVSHAFSLHSSWVQKSWQSAICVNLHKIATAVSYIEEKFNCFITAQKYCSTGVRVHVSTFVSVIIHFKFL
jgi:hypothetical protein